VKDGILHGEKWDEIEYLAAAMFLRICVCFFLFLKEIFIERNIIEG